LANANTKTVSKVKFVKKFKTGRLNWVFTDSGIRKRLNEFIKDPELLDEIDSSTPNRTCCGSGV